MKDWKQIISGVAPTLATVLGGPSAGVATKFLAKVLLGKDDGTESDIQDFVLNASPESFAELKKAELNFKAKLKELDLSLAELSVRNSESARKLASNKGILPHVILSSVFIFGFFAVLWVLFSGQISIDETVRDSALILLGVLGTNVTLIMKFWFGGSPQDSENLDKIYNSTPRR